MEQSKLCLDRGNYDGYIFYRNLGQKIKEWDYKKHGPETAETADPRDQSDKPSGLF